MKLENNNQLKVNGDIKLVILFINFFKIAEQDIKMSLSLKMFIDRNLQISDLKFVQILMEKVTERNKSCNIINYKICFHSNYHGRKC